MRKLLRSELGNDFILGMARFNWKFRRVLALLGIIAMLGSLLPNIQKTYAYPVSEVDTTQPLSTPEEVLTTSDENFDISNIELIGEEESLRTADSKTFQRVDGSYVIALYSQNVHYMKDGKWVDINNRLTLNDNTDEYSNIDNQFSIKFPKSLDENKSIKMTMNDYSISWSIIGITKSDIVTTNEEIKTNNMKELTGVTQSVQYLDVTSDVDVEYIINGSNIKENIIIDNYIKNFSMTFEYEVKNLTLVEKDGNYSFINGDGDTVFDFASLFAVDQLGEVTEQISFSVISVKKDIYQITVSLDNDWAAKASYPVTIDPSIKLSTTSSIHDTYLKENIESSYYTSTLLYAGEYFFADYISYIDFIVPSYLQDFDILYATLSLSRYNGTSTMYLNELTSYYDTFSTLKWSTRPSALQNLVDFAYFSSSNSTYTFDITSSVEKWNNLGYANMPGFEITTNGGRNLVYSIDSTTKPKIEIGYSDNNGIKNYWTYNSQDISYAGTGYISDYTQELYIIRNDISFQTDLQSLGVSFAYSNNMSISSNPNLGYGNGWNVNYNLKLYSDSPDAPYYSIDYTGNKIYYYSTSLDSRLPVEANTSYLCYLADDGSGSILVKRIVSSYLVEIFILTSDNVKYSFSTVYLDLTSVSTFSNDPDRIALTTTIYRTTNRMKIDYVVDYRGNKIDFTYGVDGNIESVSLITIDDGGTPHELERIYYTFNSSTNNLTSIYYLSDYDYYVDFQLNIYDLSNVDRIVKYSNNSSGLLFMANVEYVDKNGNISYGEDFRYHYYSSINPKISYFESYFNFIKYSEVNYDLSENQTMITDYLGNFVIYSFDRYGHTVNILDSSGNAIYYQYKDIYTDLASYVNGLPNYLENHELVYKSTPQQMTYNPVENYGFEDTAMSGWNMVANGSSFLAYPYQAKTGTHSLRIYNSGSTNSGYAEQSILLDKGVYSISIDVLNLGTNSGDVYVQVGSSTTPLYVSYSTEWQRITFDIPVVSDQTSVYIKLYSHNLGAVYFDNVTVSSATNSSWINLVNNPSFEDGLSFNWTPVSGSTINSYYINDNSGALNDLYQDVLGNGAIGVNGSVFTTFERNYFEEVEQNGGKIYVGGWALNYTGPSINNANTVDGKAFRIYVEQYNYQTLLNGSELSVPFNLSYDSWQYSFRELNLDPDCTSVKISVEYIGEGEVIFDGISVFFVANTTRYEFDEYGRLEQTFFENGTVYTYAYSTSGSPEENLIPISITDQNGHSVSILSTNGEVTGVESNNVISSPQYNEYGQISGYQIGTDDDPDEYFTTSTSYGHSSQYLSTSTDEYGKTTSYYTDVVTGLLDHINNARGSTTFYEYYEDGTLKKVSIDNSDTNEESSVMYIYDEYDRLEEIYMNEDFSYHIVYDNLGRMISVSVNNQTLMSYDYWENVYETGMISNQTYANGDEIHFNYDESTGVLLGIQFKGSGSTFVTRFEYEYDADGRLLIYHDSVNNVDEFYTYNNSGNIETILRSNGDYYTFGYDTDGSVSSIYLYIDDISSEVNYNNNESIGDSSLYDKTEYTTLNGSSVTKDYQYEATALNRLNNISLTNGIFNINENITYSGYTTRINNITYVFGGTTRYKYAYYYDNIGNITKEYYYEGASLKIYRNYEYDDLNQLIVEDSRNYEENTTYLSSTNYTKYYYYDYRGNRTDIKTFLYGQNDTTPPTIPSPDYSNNGMYSAEMVYNLYNDYTDIYSISVGQTPSLSFVYYDQWDTYHDYPLFTISTTLISSNLNTSVAGYYSQTYHATDGDFYDISFTIIIKVGYPSNTVTIPQMHIHYNFNSDWDDKLISYGEIDYINGVPQTEATLQSYTYDSQGNPTYITNFNYNGTTYYAASLSWDGRELKSMTILSGLSSPTYLIVFNYNDQGYRTKKILYTFSGYQPYITETINYTLLNDKVIYETNGTYGILFVYDYDGTLISFNYDSNVNDSIVGIEYYYIRNLMGDITHIINSSGTELVHYIYDAYGNITIDASSANMALAKINPYRYREYRYDNELSWYYLNSRYYNPQVGRFINADGLLGQVGDILSTNMFAYCANNPIMLIDPSGTMHWGWKIAIGVTVIALLFVATAMTGGAAMALLAATGSSGGYGVAAVILGSALSTATVASGIGFVSGGFFSKIEGGSFIEGAADGFMWGSITGAVSGVISASFGMINVASRLATGVINFCSTIIASGGVTAIFGLITNTFDWGAVGISTLFGMIGLSVGAKFAAGIGLGIAESISQGTYSFYFDFTLLINNIKRTSNAYF